MSSVECIEVTQVFCDGSDYGGAPEHPGIYLDIGDKREIFCPYCGKRFVTKFGAS